MTLVEEAPEEDEDPPPHEELPYKLYANRRKAEGLPVLPRPAAP